MLLNEYVYCVGITFKITERVEQRICIKFWVKLEHSSAETIRMIQKTFGDNAKSAAQLKVWHKHFKDGWESVEHDSHAGRPAPSRPPENVEHVLAAINKDWQLTVRELEADLGIPKTSGSESLMQDLACCGKIHSAASATRAEGTLCCVGRTVWGPTVLTLKGNKAPSSYVQCCLYLISSSTNVSIFHSTRLDTFWTDLMYSI